MRTRSLVRLGLEALLSPRNGQRDLFGAGCRVYTLCTHVCVYIEIA